MNTEATDVTAALMARFPELFATVRRAIKDGAEIKNVSVALEVNQAVGTKRYASVSGEGYVSWWVHDPLEF